MSTCRVTPGCTNPIENQDTGACASCGAAIRKAERQHHKDAQKKRTPIKKVSSKLSKLQGQYSAEKLLWIRGKRCVVYPDKPATTIHHAKGREGYADQWARDNDVPLLLDKRYWIPASLEGHRFIEENRAWAEEQGFTFSRSEKI